MSKKISNFIVFLAVFGTVLESIYFLYYGVTDSFSGEDATKALIHLEVWFILLIIQITNRRIVNLEKEIQELKKNR